MIGKAHRVLVKLRAETEVEITVHVLPGESLTDLTSDEERQAIAQAPRGVQWEVVRVEEVSK